MSGQAPSKISFIMKKDNFFIFSPVLQRGFKITARLGCSLKSVICDQFGVAPEYLSERIKTIFLNGRPVDDVDSAIIADNAVLALSAAMPGLVGAAFRSAGPLSVFRSSITHRDEEDKPGFSAKGRITVKLFNLLVSEMGPNFLERGIWVETGILKNLIEEKEPTWATVFKSVMIDGVIIEPKKLSQIEWNESQGYIRLSVQFDN